MIKSKVLSELRRGARFSENTPTDPSGETSVMGNFKEEDASLVQVFVREFLQNVLDNRIGVATGQPDFEPATVKIRLLSKCDGLDGRFLEAILSPSIPYIEACQKGAFPDFEHPTALVIEEYQTRGMEGDDDNSRADGNFAGFWHGEAKKNKSGSDNGRAGQGKITYNMASSVFTVFGLTNPIGESQFKLMGKCVLPRTPTVKDIEYKARGFISRWIKDHRGRDQPTPFKDKKDIDDFVESFKLERKLGESGTSFVIPFPQMIFTEEKIIYSVIKDFFYSIVRERLIVHVGSVKLDASTLASEAKDRLIEESDFTVDYFDFIQDAVTIPEQNILEFPKEWQSHTHLPHDLLEESVSESLRKRFVDNETVAIRLPIEIVPKETGKINSYLDVFLKSVGSEMATKEAFIRTDLFISRVKRLRSRPGNVYGIVVAEDKGVAAFLADSEIANHLDFSAAQDKVIENYQKVRGTLTEIRMAMPRVYDFLIHREDELVEDLLVGLLSIEEPGGKKKKRSRKGKKIGPVSPAKPTLIIPPSKNHLNVKDGVGVEVTAGIDFNASMIPLKVKLKAAYASISGEGNPFKLYHPFDFDFNNSSQISIEKKNVTIDVYDPNTLIATIDDLDFVLKLSGFNQAERVVVKVTY